MSRHSRIQKILRELSSVPGLEAETDLLKDVSANAREEDRERRASIFNELMADTDPVQETLSELERKGYLLRGRKTPEAIQQILARDAADRMKLEAAVVSGAPDTKGIYITIPIPEPHASRWPDPVTHNHGLAPHLTLCFVGADRDMSEGYQVHYLVRSVCRRIKPFRVVVDTQGGLSDFGPTESGEKALWIRSRSDPEPALHQAHRMIRLALEREGIKVDAHKPFKPHVTWAYVLNDISDRDYQKMDQSMVGRFKGGVWFDVRHLHVTLPDGKTRVVTLNGSLR